MTTTSPCSGPCTACGGEGEVAAEGVDTCDDLVGMHAESTALADLLRDEDAGAALQRLATEAEAPEFSCPSTTVAVASGITAADVFALRPLRLR